MNVNAVENEKKIIDLNIPVIYQSLSANTQNVIDRLTNDDGLSEIQKSEVFVEPDCECNHSFQRSSVFRLSERVVPIVEPHAKIGKGLQSVEGSIKKNIKKSEIIFDDHLLPFDEFLKRHDTSVELGLTSKCVDDRRIRDGKNVLPRKKGDSHVKKYLIELFGSFNVIMWTASILCLICWKPLGMPNPEKYNLILSCILSVTIVCQATFSFVQQFRTDNLMASFEKLMPHKTTVLRDGNWKNVNTWELVVGDVVQLNAGDKVPADIRVVQCNQASVETSSLTGESEPIRLSVNTVNANPYETRNIVLFGSMLLEGTLTGIVFQTGKQTVMSKIANLTQNTAKDLSTMEREINYFAMVISFLAITTGIFAYFLWFFLVKFYHPDYLQYKGILIACIGLVVSYIPEGLQIAVTMTLTLVASKMKNVNVLVKKLSIIETLGSTTVIASDKTGTITMNRMTLANLMVCGADEANLLTIDTTAQLSGLYMILMKFAILCNKAILNYQVNSDQSPMADDKEEKFIGSPTECGILKRTMSFINVNKIRMDNPMVFEIPFNSKYKYHASMHRLSELHDWTTCESKAISHMALGNTHLLIMKGAPEVVADYCQQGLYGDCVEDFSVIKAECFKKAHFFAANGERVLGLAFGFVKYDETTKDCFDETNIPKTLCFHGLLSLIDPPRPGVGAAVNICHEGGIKVMMVTGDHHLTAVSIATMVNIIRSNKAIKYFDDVKMKIEGNPKYELQNRNTVCHCKKLSVIEMIKNKILPRGPTLIAKKFKVDGAVVIQGKDILSMDDDHWDYVLSHNEIVFARTTPQNKLLIVSQLQRRGEIVTVTGDGVNDAPALKKADIGIAMGISGTEISKEASTVIIIDDNFATIVNGIHQGRLLFDNLKKVIAYLLPAGCFSEILPVLAYIFIGLPLPLTTLQMIAICLGTDIIGSMGMVYEYQESDLMKRKPRNAIVDHLISFSAVMKIYFQTGLIQSTIAFFMYFYTMHQAGIDTSQLLFAYEKWDANEIFAGVDLDTRKDALSFAQTGYFVALVMTQIINLFTVRTRYQSFFKQKFRPSLIFIALGEIAIVVFLCFTTPLRPYLETHIAAWYHFVFPLLMGLSIFFVDEFKKLMIRKFPNTFLAKLVW